MTSHSDDEIFFNKLTIRNMKKVVNKRRRSSIKYNSRRFEGIDADNSLKIIETSSEPDLTSRLALNNSISSHESDLDKSFCDIDKIVADFELRYNINTQVVDKSKAIIEKVSELEVKTEILNNHDREEIDIQIENKTLQKMILKDEKYDTDSFRKHISPKLSEKSDTLKTSNKNKLINNHGNVPRNPSKFEHIRSPVAMYIKQGPQVPLLQNVKPEKPLAGTHSIPDLLNGLKTKSIVMYKPLPSVAYKCAKDTKVIEIPDEKKLPHCQWAKKLMSSLPRAVVVRHVERENITLSKKKESQTDNSFADLTLHQAKLSICTLESAYDKKKTRMCK